MTAHRREKVKTIVRCSLLAALVLTAAMMTPALADGIPPGGQDPTRAVALPQYSDTHEFNMPERVQIVAIDKDTNLPADSTCMGDTYNAAFLDGTVPQTTCSHPSTDKRNFLQKIFGIGEKKP